MNLTGFCLGGLGVGWFQVAEQLEEKLGYLGTKGSTAASGGSLSGVRTELDVFLDDEAASGSGLGGGLRDLRGLKGGVKPDPGLLVGLDW